MVMLGWALGTLVASYLITYLLTPTPPGAERTAFSDIDFPQAEEGTPQSVVFGDCWIPDWTVLAVGSYRTAGIYASGGK